MGRRQIDSELARKASLLIFSMAVISWCVSYIFFSTAYRPLTHALDLRIDDEKEGQSGCCRGIEHLELWGDAVKWGSEFKVNSSEECCRACKQMGNGPRLCDSWVYCGDRDACGSRFGECWLKKQKDTLAPDRRDSGDQVMWTSGLILGGKEGIVELKTEYGVFRLKLLPHCAPHSVSYIIELLALRHCVGCKFYRAESRGSFWDSEGNHVIHAPFGPPFAMIQGTLEAHGVVFKSIRAEYCPTIERGSVAWVGSGPEFFISLANHHEWRKAYTVFGYVLPEDMKIAEQITRLPTIRDTWSNITVSILERPVPLSLRRLKRST